MKNKYTLKSILENIEEEIQKENNPQRIKLESIIDKIIAKVGSLNSAYQLIDELRNTIRLRDEIDDSMSNVLQIMSPVCLVSRSTVQLPGCVAVCSLSDKPTLYKLTLLSDIFLLKHSIKFLFDSKQITLSNSLAKGLVHCPILLLMSKQVL